LLFPRFDGTVADRGGYLAVHTPANPGFYWGNFLLFSHAPHAGALDRWTRLFEREFGHDTAVRHQSFGWDSVDGELGDAQAFVDAGFELQNDAVMTLDRARPRARPAPRPADVTVRALASDEDWASMNALNIAGDQMDGKDDDYAAFKQQLRDRYRSMVRGGLGVWLGAFDGARQVGQLGLFAAGELARFQSVETHPDWRNRGVCSTLLAAACGVGFEELGAERLVLAANEHSQAQRIYRAAGFEVVQRQVGVFRHPADTS
jgi:ribosomal protein S18 acetylase RimI-like enzyme